MNMAKAQFPIDGKQGKAWKITSPFGWRVHPIEKIKKHHNGDDIWGPHPKIWIEAWYDGTVLYAGPSKLKKSDGSLGGIGYYVDIRSKINGKWYTTRSGHMEEGSLKVKTGQKVEAGTPLGIMGNTGASAGRHLHFEIVEGKKHVWDLKGKGFVSPIAFVKSIIQQEKLAEEGKLPASETAPVTEAPLNHEEAGAKLVEQDEVASTPAPAVAAPKKPARAKKPGAGIALHPFIEKSGVTPGTPEAVLALAKFFVDKKYVEGPKKDTIFGKFMGLNFAPWCASFVSYIFQKSGSGNVVRNTQTAKGYVGCTAGINGLKKKGFEVVKVTEALPGDIIFFDWEKDKDPDHTGIVLKTNPKKKTITCYEGNTTNGMGGSQSNGGGVFKRDRRYDQVHVVIRPKFKATSVSKTAAPTVSETAPTT
jgi:murein DD-endopeptidase MepM/ murein hydrolase activator NlpD